MVAIDPSGDFAAEGEQQRGTQKQPGNHFVKGRLPGFEQQDGADNAAQKRNNDQWQNALEQFRAQRLAISPGRSQRPGPQGDGTGSIGIDGRHAGKKECGKSNKAASSGDGIDRATDRGGEKKKDGV